LIKRKDENYFCNFSCLLIFLFKKEKIKKKKLLTNGGFAFKYFDVVCSCHRMGSGSPKRKNSGMANSGYIYIYTHTK